LVRHPLREIASFRGKTMARRGKSGSSSSGVQRYQGALLRGSSV
jgi:hypothetical protein